MDENLVMTEFKESFGEINTPFSLVKEMLSLFPHDFLFNKNNKWLSCGQVYLDFVSLYYQKYQIPTYFKQYLFIRIEKEKKI